MAKIIYSQASVYAGSFFCGIERFFNSFYRSVSVGDDFRCFFVFILDLPFFQEFYTRILHELEAFICKAFKGEAIVNYCDSLITQQVKASGSPFG